MILIEHDSQLDSLKDKQFKLVVPVWSTPRGHEWGFPVSFYYLRDEQDEYVVNLRHIDAATVSEFDITKYVGEDTYVLGSRYLDTKGLDYEWAYFESFGAPFTFFDFVSSVYRTYRTEYTELNDCVPLIKWVERFRELPMPPAPKPWYRQYTNAIHILGQIEKSGVRVDETRVIGEWNVRKEYIHGGCLYTKYNPYTVTGRPSNRHLRVNWSALNKSDGSREIVRTRFDGGSLIQFDFESFHIRLIGKLVEYQFPEGKTAHEHLADWYACTVVADAPYGNVDRETAKGITFKYLYGGLDEAGYKIPFFKKVDEYIKSLYRNFVMTGNIKTPLFGREINFKRIEDPTEQKVFNYFLQALETEVNYHKMEQLMHWFDGLQSKIVLYTYDAFLIDAHPSEREGVLREVRRVLEQGGFPTKISEGTDYANLRVL